MVALLVAVGAVAAATIVPAAGAAGCSDRSYVSRLSATKQHIDNAIADEKQGQYNTASNKWLAISQTVRFAPVPCSSSLQVSRTRTLRMILDRVLADDMFTNGETSAGNEYVAAYNHERVLAAGVLPAPPMAVAGTAASTTPSMGASAGPYSWSSTGWTMGTLQTAMLKDNNRVLTLERAPFRLTSTKCLAEDPTHAFCVGLMANSNTPSKTMKIDWKGFRQTWIVILAKDGTFKYLPGKTLAP
jgi:hypothetical protein